MAEISHTILFVLKAVLNLQLSVWRETITGCDIGAPEIMPKRRVFTTVAIGHFRKELLVPAQRSEKLGSELIFRLQIVGETIRVSDRWDFEARFVEFRPELQMMPGKTDVLAKHTLMVVADIAASGQTRFRFRP